MNRDLLLAPIGVGLVMAVGAYPGARIERKVSDNAVKCIVEPVVALASVTLLVQRAR